MLLRIIFTLVFMTVVSPLVAHAKDLGEDSQSCHADLVTNSIFALGNGDFVRTFRCADEAMARLYYVQKICFGTDLTFTITKKWARIHIDAGGRGEFDFDKLDDTLLAGRMSIEKNFKHKGIGTALFEIASALHPFAIRFSVPLLSEDNRDVIDAALADGKSVAEAVELSPMFRIVRRLGFYKVHSIDLSSRTFGKGPKYGFDAVKSVSK